MLRCKNWSPYLSGIIIGLLQIPIVIFLHDTLGTSSSLIEIIRVIHAQIDQSTSFAHPYIWQIAMIIGVILGAYISAKLSQINRPKIAPIWQRVFKIKSAKSRYLMAFIGGFLLFTGARISNGCTSGNGISGISQLDASAFAVIIFMFISAIIMVNLIKYLAGK